MQTVQRLLAGVAAMGSLMLGGCAASTSPSFDARFGDSVRSLQAQQTLDPAAPARNGTQTVRSDGRSAAEANVRYVDSFKAPPAPAVPVFNFTSGGGGSSN